MKRAIILSLTLSISSILFSQNEGLANTYYVVNSDTSYFEKVNFLTGAVGMGLIKVSYTDLEGNSKELSGNDIPAIETFCINGVTWDRVPAYPMIEEGTPRAKAFKFMQRIVSGRINLYYLETTMSTTEMTSTDISIFIKTPDGSFYNVEKKKQLKTYVIPFLEGCKEFKHSYTGKYKTSTAEFTKIVNLFNTSCNE